jgi:hypothetical protein
MNCRRWVGRWTQGLAAFAAGIVLLAPALRAEDAAPPAQAVRLSSVEGQVRIAQDNQVLADPALANTPLFEGTLVQTSTDGRAELQFDDGSVVRLSPNSSLKLTALRGQGAPGDTEISLVSGLGYFELQGESAAGQIRVRFGDSSVTASGSAVLRINLDNPPGELAVFSGDAHLERGATLALDLHGGESVTLSGSDPMQFALADSIEPDSWDAWNSDRDQALTTESSVRTEAVSDQPDNNNPAWNDLDANGNWYDVPGQGYVWSPYEASNAGWDPYGNGNWMWTPSYSYIWVSGYPWGYMPYQCGAWNYFGGFGWGWAPGRCRLWWGGGAGWISNIGYGPGGYRPPLRPHGPPSRGAGGRVPRGGAATPLVAVKRPSSSGAAWLPARDSSTVATIAGHQVQSLRPVSPRPIYDGSTAGAANRSRPVYAGPRTPAGQRPVNGSHPGSVPAARFSSGSQRTASPPPSHYSSGGGSSPSPSHSSGGGGGGGGGSSPRSGGGHR